jgi:hypothetical protein
VPARLGPATLALPRRGKGPAIETVDEFARKLNTLRTASGKSHRRLADDCGLGFTTIAGYCRGEHLPQLGVHGEFQRLLTSLGVPAGKAQNEWFEALASLRSRTGRSVASATNPYPGLRAFQPEDAALFFGRQELTGRLLDAVAACRPAGSLLVVVGSSGSGKSSLLRAGLMPNVRSPVLITPGARPMEQWAHRVAAEDGVAATAEPAARPHAATATAPSSASRQPPAASRQPPAVTTARLPGCRIMVSF